MLLCKCQIQIVIRKMTNKGIAMLCQHINDSLCDCYITILEDVNLPNRPGTCNCPNIQTFAKAKLHQLARQSHVYLTHYIGDN